MAPKQTGGLDPRFDAAFQRGGAGAEVGAEAVAVRDTPLTAPMLDAGVAVAGVGLAGESMPRGRMSSASSATLDASRPDERHFELVVAGNPWLRALWGVGAAATLLGFVLTFYAEFAFSVPPASGIYDPSAYVVPRVAEALALPLVIAGVVALVAAVGLRIVAWRPSGATAIVRD